MHLHSPFFDLISLFFLLYKPLHSSHMLGPRLLMHSEILGTETFLALFQSSTVLFEQDILPLYQGVGPVFSYGCFTLLIPLVERISIRLLLSHSHDGRLPPQYYLLQSNSLTDIHVPLAELELSFCLQMDLFLSQKIPITVGETISKSSTLSTWPVHCNSLFTVRCA